MKKFTVLILLAAGVMLFLHTVSAATIKEKIMRTPCMIASDMINASAKKLELRHLPFDDSAEIFSKKYLLSGKEKSWEEIFQSMEAHYQHLHVSLEAQWGLDEPLLRAAFLLAAVTNLWSVGHPEIKQASVEQFFRQKHKGRIIPVSSYLESPYADCNDFATMLYMLLKLAGFEARHVGTEDHIYIEAVIQHKSYIMDATYGFFTSMTHQEFLNQGFSQATYYLVPYNGGLPGTPLYRRTGVALRMAYILARGRILKLQPKDYSHWDEFNAWLILNGTEIDGDLQGIELPKESRKTTSHS